MPRILRPALGVAMACVSGLAATTAAANVTFSDAAGYSVGIGPDGELYDATSGVGLRSPTGADYIAPGTPRDSWGISAAQGGSAYADYEFAGTQGITGTVITTSTNAAGVTTATAVSTTSMGLTVTQTYSFFASNILVVQEKVTNVGGAAQTVTFRRDVDLDVSPNLVDDNVVGPLGADSQVLQSSYYGFESPDPTQPFADLCTSGCNEVGDLGAGIDLSLGTIAAGGSVTFDYFYGINAPGQTLDQLFAEAQSDGLLYLIGDQGPSYAPGAGFLGVGLVSSAPEPASWAMILLGFLGLGGALRARRRTDRRLQAFAAEGA